MIDVTRAAEEAALYLQKLLPGKELPGLEVEEVELSGDEKFWYITLGYYEDVLRTRKTYKLFKIKSVDGKVLSMKVRTVS